MGWFMYVKGPKIFAFLMLTLLIQSCSSERVQTSEKIDSFTEKLIQNVPKLQTNSKIVTGSSTIIFPLWVLAVPESNLLIFAENSDKTIRLFDEKGSEYSAVGGEGRGPGEFENINQLHFGYDKRLYVLDLKLMRLNIFSIDNGGLNFDSAIGLEIKPNLFLQTIYVTKLGNYGVFSQRDADQQSESRFLLFRLDNDFHPVKQLLEMPGNDQQQVSSNLFMDSYFGRRTYWDLHNEWFYYITSHQPIIHKFSLKAESMNDTLHLDLPRRLNDLENMSLIKDRLYFIKEDFHWKVLEESTSWPLFRDFRVQNNSMFFYTFFPNSDNGIYLYTDMTSKETKYFYTPYEFQRVSLRDETVYGIDASSTTGGYQIMAIDLLYYKE